MRDESTQKAVRERLAAAARAVAVIIPAFIATSYDARSIPKPGEITELTLRGVLQHMPCTCLTIGIYIAVVVAMALYCAVMDPRFAEECAEKAIRLNGEERREWFKKIERDLGSEFLEKVIAAL